MIASAHSTVFRQGTMPFPVEIGSHAPRSLFLGNAEPPLAELISDDVVLRMMARDGVGVADLLGLIDAVRKRLG